MPNAWFVSHKKLSRDRLAWLSQLARASVPEAKATRANTLPSIRETVEKCAKGDFIFVAAGHVENGDAFTVPLGRTIIGVSSRSADSRGRSRPKLRISDA